MGAPHRATAASAQPATTAPTHPTTIAPVHPAAITATHPATAGPEHPVTATPTQPATAEVPGPGGEGAAPATGATGPGADPAWRPALSPSVLLRRDRVRQADLLVLPERVVVLAGSAAEVLRLCDGRRDVATLVAELAGRHPGAPVADEVPRFLARLRDAGWLR